MDPGFASPLGSSGIESQAFFLGFNNQMRSCLFFFAGKNTSNGGENASRSLLLETAFRYDPEKEDLEGIFNPPSPISAVSPDSTPLRSVLHNVSGQVSSLSLAAISFL